MFIGDIELPIVNNIEKGGDSDFTEITSNVKNVGVKHEKNVEQVSIVGYLNQETHSNSLSLGEQKDQLKSLKNKHKSENSINYRKFKGHLLVEEVNVVEDGSSRIVKEAEIIARYFPWPKYFPDNQP